jgi:hypothetical protein
VTELQDGWQLLQPRKPWELLAALRGDVSPEKGHRVWATNGMSEKWRDSQQESNSALITSIFSWSFITIYLWYWDLNPGPTL